MARGLMAGRDILRKSKELKWLDINYARRQISKESKYDPLEGAHQAKGIVLEKRQFEQKQPSSGLIKCVRIQLIKNGKQITAHCPENGAINHVSEHDEVVVEGIGGSNSGPYGSLPSVKWKVIKVNGVPLQMLVRGKAKRPTK